ncbi:Phosphoserine transaminase [Taxawa tesnikishii (nom. ined.)]|nr:Phosphoserine transaminase [Dothideales sp. JES 119]
MPTRADTHYFGAGPAPLPTPVLEAASQVLLNYNDTGIAGTKSALRQLLDIPEHGRDGYDIMFLQGGGSGEFSASVYHMTALWVEKRRSRIAEEEKDEDKVLQRLREEVKKMRIDYLVTGSWSLKASQEAARLRGKFGVIPAEQEWKLTEKKEDSAMVYFCDNETVDGVEFPAFPSCLESGDYPVVADMSSNFLSRKVDVRKYSAIFGGAQKNVGTTGITIAIVKNSLLPPNADLAKPDLLRKLGLPVGPVVLDWPTISKNNSLYNTLPIFDVWIAGQVMQGLLDKHPSSTSQPRIQGQQDESEKKASMIYRVLDSYPDVYHVVPDKSVRSRMNICFRAGKADERDAKEKALVSGAGKRGLQGIKGHRSVGGCRISNYNAVSVASVEKLVSFLEEFAQSK